VSTEDHSFLSDFFLNQKITLEKCLEPTSKGTKRAIRASTFTGLCSPHDAEIFRPIDTENFNPRSQEHLFLIAYRSVYLVPSCSPLIRE
jgi:hypothetical protein